MGVGTYEASFTITLDTTEASAFLAALRRALTYRRKHFRGRAGEAYRRRCAHWNSR